MAIQKEIWQRAIVEGLFADNSFASKAVNDDAYVNEGKKVHIPNAGAPSKVVKNRSTVPATAVKRNDTDVDYTLDEYSTDPVCIPDADTVELSYDKRNSVISQDRAQLLDEAHNGLLVKWAPSSNHCLSTSGSAVAAHTDKATGNRKAVTKDDIKTLMTKFNGENIPQEGRYLLLDAEMYSQLLESLTETDRIGFFNAADVKRGVIGKIYSFEVMNPRSQVLRYAADGTVKEFSAEGVATDNAAGLAWSEHSVSRALGEVKVFSNSDDPTYYGDVYSFIVRVGGAIRRADGKGVWAIVESAAANSASATGGSSSN
ncbi:MAG: hypothetical protein ACI3Y2_06850 [Candidatus Egerieousia sp.]